MSDTPNDWIDVKTDGDKYYEYADVFVDDELVASVTRSDDGEVKVRVFEPGHPEDTVDGYLFEAVPE